MALPPTGDAAPLPAALGEVIGAYRLEAILGRGGMGCVYRGVHETLGRPAAIKVMHGWVAEDAGYASQLRLEATLITGLRHPHIVDVLDFVETDSPPRVACVMELLEGPTLAELIARGPLPAARALAVGHQLAQALMAVHAEGIVHRDVTPANVIASSADAKHVKLLDFGIAKVTDPSLAARTLTEGLVGTPAYMAPEQLAGEAATPATDVYGLALVVLEMLTGRRLFAASGLAMLREKLEGVSRLDLPPGLAGRPVLEALLVAALAGDPPERPWLDEIAPRLRDLAALQGPGARATG